MRLMSVTAVHKLFTLPFDPNNAKRAAAKKIFGKLYGTIKKDWEDKTGGSVLDAGFIKKMEGLIPHWETYETLTKAISDAWWKDGMDRADAGTATHGKSLAADIEAGCCLNHATGEYVAPIYCSRKEMGDNESGDLANLPSGAHLELLLYHLFPEPVFSQSMQCWICGVAGQLDKALIEGKDVYVEDIKTNEDLEDFGFKYNNAERERHLYPFDRLVKTKLSPYKIQLPTYAWLLELWGYNVRGVRILNYGNIIEVPYTPGLIAEALSIVFTSSL